MIQVYFNVWADPTFPNYASIHKRFSLKKTVQNTFYGITTVAIPSQIKSIYAKPFTSLQREVTAVWNERLQNISALIPLAVLISLIGRSVSPINRMWGWVTHTPYIPGMHCEKENAVDGGGGERDGGLTQAGRRTAAAAEQQQGRRKRRFIIPLLFFVVISGCP